MKAYHWFYREKGVGQMYAYDVRFVYPLTERQFRAYLRETFEFKRLPSRFEVWGHSEHKEFNVLQWRARNPLVY